MEPFFVVGADRSGTTLLRLMLNGHSHLHVPRESWFLTDLMNALPLTGSLAREQVDQAFEIIRGHERWFDWGIGDAQLREALDALERPSLAQLIDAVFRLAGGGTGRRWGDKTPGYIMEMDRLAYLFPQARFIHLIRDARDVCLSLSHVCWHGRMYKDWAHYWSESIEAGIASGRRLGRGRYLEVTYEDLVRDSTDELKRVCQFLEVPFETGMLSYYQDAQREVAPWEHHLHRKTEQPPDPANTVKWRNELSALQVLSVEAVAGGTMLKAGQTWRFSGPARMVCLAWRVIIWLGEWSLPTRRRLGIHCRWLRGTI